MIYKENSIVCVDDLSKEFNKSKATIYKKLKSNKELKKPIIRKDRKTYISPEAVQWLQSVYSENFNKCEEDIKNNLLYKPIKEESKVQTENTVVNINKNVKDEINEPSSKKSFLDENDKKQESYETKENNEKHQTDNKEKNNIEALESKESKDDSLVVSSKKIYDNVVTTGEAIPTTEFSSKERIPLSLDNEVFGLLKSYVKFLETECTTKNKQLDNKDDIIKNMQVLLENEQDIVSSHVNLEDRCREMDDKLFQLKGQLENRQKKHKKSFLKKLFKL